MGIRMTGLNSGLDTEEIVKALMSAHSMKKTKVENKKTKLEWKQDKWKELNTKITNFYQSFASKMRLQTTYKTKSAKSSNENLVSATATAKASNGANSIKINRLASGQYVTSGKVTSADGSKVKGSTKLSDLGYGGTGTQISVTSGGKTTTLAISDSTTVDEFVSNLSRAGINASFDEDQQRFFIQSATSGDEAAFTMTAYNMSAAQEATVTNLRSALNYENSSSSERATIDSAISALMNGTDKEKTEAQTKLQELWDAQSKAAATNDLEKLKRGELTGKWLVTTGTGDDAVTTLTAEAEAYLQAKVDAGEIDEETYNTWVAEDKVAAIKSMIDTETGNYMESDETKQKIVDMVENGFTTSDGKTFDSTASRTYQLNNMTQDVITAAQAGGQTVNSTALNALKLSNVDGSEVRNGSDASGMTVVAATNCEVELNGAILESATNTISANGVTFEAKGVTKGEAVTITVANDVTGVYDTIKEAIGEYNKLLKEMNELYYADSAKGYEPLTSEEKEDMSDDEIEKWEKKIKDSLLRRDSNLGDLLSAMKNAMMSSVNIDGKNYSLSSLGIMTSTDYTEKGLLHIFGDTTDATYAEKDDKLKKMLEDDPDKVTQILSGIFGNLYNTMTKKQSSNSMRSSHSFYNDKEMTKQLSNYKKDIKKWETKLKDYEDRYYKQFTAMEKALALLNSQQSALGGMFGNS